LLLQGSGLTPVVQDEVVSIASFEKGNLLVISQTAEVQEEIGRLLKVLRHFPAQKVPFAKPTSEKSSQSPDARGGNGAS